MESTINPTPPKTGLQPLGESLSQSWQLLKSHWQKLILIILVMVAPSLFNEILTQLFGQEPNPLIRVLMIVMGLLAIVTSIWGTIAIITYLMEKNNQMTIAEAFNKNASLFWSYLWASIIVGVIVMLATILLIIPGIIVGVYFSFFSYVLIAEKIKGYSAAKRSKELVTGYWWDVLGRMVVLGLIYIGILIALMLIIVPLAWLTPWLSNLVLTILMLPLGAYSSIYFFRLYENLKQIKNG
jgi:hypothetical protein